MLIQAGFSNGCFMKDPMLININFNDWAKIKSSFSLYF